MGLDWTIFDIKKKSWKSLSRICQSSHFLLGDATVLLRWFLQYGRRWLHFPNNRCSIQFYFSNQ